MRNKRLSAAAAAALLDLPDDTLLTDEEAASVRRNNAKTLARERIAGTGCPYVKVGRSIRYRLADLKQFLRAQTVRSTAEADQRRHRHKAA